MAGKKQGFTARITDYPKQDVIVDTDTGEIIKLTETVSTRTIEVPIMEGYVDMKLPQKFRFNNGGFITIFQKAMANIALFAKLSKEEYRILLYLIGTCGIDNSICIDLVQLGDNLGMKKPNVSRALKGLVERNIILRKDGYRYGKNPLPMELSLNYDQINYNIAYNGKIKTFKENLGKHPALTDGNGNNLDKESVNFIEVDGEKVAALPFKD